MESLSISNFSVNLSKESDKNYQPWIYCVLKSSQQTYCSRNKESIFKDWTPLITSDFPLQMEFPRNHNLFRLEIWDYDRQQKIGETNITNGDIPASDRQKQFSICDKKIHLRFVYERKGRVQQTVQSQNSTIRMSYNRTDSGLKLVSKPGSAYVRKVVSPSEQTSPNTKYDPSYYGKWKFIPIRNDTTQKLKL